MGKVQLMNYQLLKKHLPSENTRIIGIYATEAAANFIQSKLESRPEKVPVEFIIEQTDESLRPENSYRVDKYLFALSLKQPQ